MPEEKTAMNATKNKERTETFLESLRRGVSVLKASKTAGIDYSTIWRWRKKYKIFDSQVLAILDSRTQIVEDALFMNAASGNITAQIFWLKNRASDRWSDRHEHQLGGGIDVLVRYAGEKGGKDGNGKKVE